MSRQLVVVKREWHDAAITVNVTDEAIEVVMPLDEFVNALAVQAGNPTMLMTNEALRRRLQDAAVEVVRGMKLETRRVM